jgi:hypothetical protein
MSGDADDLPGLTRRPIRRSWTTYLMFAKSNYTLTDFKVYKSLEAYNQFACGWVRDVKTLKISEHTLILGMVRKLLMRWNEMSVFNSVAWASWG